MTSTDKRLRAADFTAAHWHQHAIDSGNIPGAHAIACIRAALKGETDPNQLGLDDHVHDAFRATLDAPPGPTATQTTEAAEGGHDFGTDPRWNCRHCGTRHIDWVNTGKTCPAASSPLLELIADAIGRTNLPMWPKAHRYEAAQAALAAILPTTRLLSDLHRSAHEDVKRVTALYEQWVKTGPPPVGTSMARWWDARLVELHDAILPPDQQPATPDEPKQQPRPTPFECTRENPCHACAVCWS